MRRMATDPRSPVGASATAPEPAEAPASPDVGHAVALSVAPATGISDDTIGRIASVCPYLRMADGTHRALAPSRDHRCWTDEPPTSIPAATQGELCLVAAHARCERYVAARERRAAGLATDHIPPRLVTTPRFAIPVDPLPVVVDARASGRDTGAIPPMTAELARRRLPLVAAVVVVLVIGVVGLAVILGGSAGAPAPTAPLAAAAGTTAPTSLSAATPAPTPLATASATSDGSAPAATDAAVVPQAEATPTPQPSYPVAIRRTYLVKEGDTYRSIAKRFDLRPKDLRALNGPLVVGERILIPAMPWVTDAPSG
jgi:LysM repeat protein